MSQWGEQKSFITADGEITVSPLVESAGGPFTDLRVDGVITDIIVTGWRGNIIGLEARARAFIGKTYGEWLR